MKKTLSLKKQIVICAGIAVAALAVLAGSNFIAEISGSVASTPDSSGRHQRSTGVPVIVSEVRHVRDNFKYETVGTGVASRSVMLRSEAEGVVLSSRLSSGKPFSAGETLLTLESQDEELALRLAETRFRQAERDKERLSDLLERGITPETVYNEAVTAADLAQLEYKRARVALENRKLQAPFDGVAGLPAVEPGDRIQAGDQIASFDDRSKLMVEFDLPETLLNRVDDGKALNATTVSVPNRVFEGRIVSIDSRIDPQKRSARVRVEIPNDDDLLRPGASFTLRLDLKGAEFPAVPELALQFARGGLYVWRVSEDAARKVEVKLIRRQSGKVLVDGPLVAGDQVVIEGTQRLSDGRSVHVLGHQKEPD